MACFSPTKLNWITTIKQCFFNIWPNLRVENVKSYLTKFIANNLGHIKHTRKGMEKMKMPQQSNKKRDFCDDLQHQIQDLHTSIWMIPGTVRSREKLYFHLIRLRQQHHLDNFPEE